MRHGVAEQARKALLCGIVQMQLVAEEQHLVPEQGCADGGEGGGRQVAVQRDAADLGADAAGNRVDVELDGLVLRGVGLGHHEAPGM